MNALAARSEYEIPISEIRARTAKLRADVMPALELPLVKHRRTYMPLITGRVCKRTVRWMGIAATREIRAEEKKAANDNAAAKAAA